MNTKHALVKDALFSSKQQENCLHGLLFVQQIGWAE